MTLGDLLKCRCATTHKVLSTTRVVREGWNHGDLTYSHVSKGRLRDPPTTPLRPWPMRLLKFSELRPLTLSSDAALLSPQPKDMELFGPL